MADTSFTKISDIIGRPSTGTEKKNEHKSSLGQDDFLKILITQMQNQDPTQPLKDTEFIAQMAQFTSVEQQAKMADELKLMRQSLGMSSSLIGKSVSWMGKTETGDPVMKSGLVDSIIIRAGSQYATVSGEEISLESITKIENQPEKDESTPEVEETTPEVEETTPEEKPEQQETQPEQVTEDKPI
jgi:flagellar basal-body rod modification protein FlgD